MIGKFHTSLAFVAGFALAGLLTGSGAMAASVLEKSACMAMGNTDAACACADKSATDGFQKAVTPAVFAAITSGKPDEVKKLAAGDQEGGFKALMSVTADAVKACGVKLK